MTRLWPAGEAVRTWGEAATPAGFASHQTHRSKQDKIAVDLIDAEVDVMLGGGLAWWIPQEANDPDSETYRRLAKRTGETIEIRSKRRDSRDLFEEAGAGGLALCFNRTQLEQASGDRLLGLFARDILMNGIRETRTKEDPGRTIPTLREMTEKALHVLSRNPNGFFLVVEAGLIDWAGHDHDTGTLLHEMLKFDETVALVHEWAQGRKDTLVLVTADHGLIDTGPGDRIDLANHPELEACLSLPLCGEPRAAFCYLRPRRVQDFQDYCQHILDGHALLKPSQELIHQGLFGQGEPHPGLEDRVGDYTLLLTGRSVIRDQLPSEKGTVQIGVHGGLSATELQVPLCVIAPPMKK